MTIAASSSVPTAKEIVAAASSGRAPEPRVDRRLQGDAATDDGHQENCQTLSMP
jgi:hypothetical protein